MGSAGRGRCRDGGRQRQGQYRARGGGSGSLREGRSPSVRVSVEGSWSVWKGHGKVQPVTVSVERSWTVLKGHRKRVKGSWHEESKG